MEVDPTDPAMRSPFRTDDRESLDGLRERIGVALLCADTTRRNKANDDCDSDNAPSVTSAETLAVDRLEDRPSADVAAVSPVPAQMWQGRAQP